MCNKPILFSLIAMLLSGYGHAQKTYDVTGSVEGIRKGVALLVASETRDTLDKVKIKNGAFRFSGKWPDADAHVVPSIVLCTQKDKAKSLSASLALEPYPLKVGLGLDKLPVYWGSEFQKNFTALIKHTDILIQQMHDPVTGDIVEPVRKNFSRILEVFYTEYEPDYYKGFVTLLITDHLSRGMAHPNDFMKLPGKCYKGGCIDRYDTLLCASFASFRENWLGLTPMHIKGVTYDGKAFSLQDLLGEKNLLIVFWTSTSDACIRDISALREYYSKYNIEILGISTDLKATEYRKAVEKMELPWINIHDATGDIQKVYNIKAVPTKLVINKNGVIVGRNPEDLEGLIIALQ